MTKSEYLDALKKGLSSLPFSEQEDAIRYYEEYFDDAGEENEQRVMEELGPPAELARNIIANAGSNLPAMPHTPTQNQPPQPDPKKNSVTFWLLLLLTSFIWLPLLGTILSLVLCIIIFIFSLLFTTAVLSISLLFSAVCTLILAIPLLPTADAILLIGLALLYLGGALLTGTATFLLFKYFLPWCWKQAKKLVHSAKNRWKKHTASEKG